MRDPMRDPMPLSGVAALIGAHAVGGDARSVDVTGVRHDSREVAPRDLFVAIRGFTSDGHVFAAQAEQRGAAALCVETPVSSGLPQLVVSDTRAALGPAAAAVYGNPSRRMAVVGVTGTNGKTTVAHFLEAIVDAAGRRSGVAGTLGARIAGRPVPLARTTPEADDLQRLLATMVEEGVDVAGLEVSSHALALGRVAATRFAVTAFTNLSRDHLDFHGDMEAYYEAKATLFTDWRCPSVVYADDPWGQRLLAERRAADPLPAGRSGQHPVRSEDERLGIDGSRFLLVTPAGSAPVQLGLPGGFNVANALVAAGCAHVLGIAPAEIAAGLGAVRSVPGRFERIDAGPGAPAVVVDYAHTPAGIAEVVAAARQVVTGRIVVVVGAGGDRDRTKRPLMGAAAAGADQVVVTSDNPRTEDPASIVAAVATGARGAGSAHVLEEPDRAAAIAAAVAACGPGDLVLVLGKGAEQGQDVGDQVIPFDDRVVARRALGVA